MTDIERALLRLEILRLIRELRDSSDPEMREAFQVFSEELTRVRHEYV